MDLRAARYLVAVAEYGTLSRAAEALFLGQSALSRAMRNLERDLGVALFDRSGSRLRLTEAGRAAEATARRMLVELDRARSRVEAVSSLTAGRLYLSTTALLSVEPLARLAGRMHHLHPGVQLHVVDGRSSAGVVDDVRRGTAEIGIAEVPGRPDGVRTERLESGALVCVLDAALAETVPDPLPAQLLGSLPWVVETADRMTFPVVHRLLAGLPEQRVVRCAHADGVWALVRHGVGAALVPAEVALQMLPGLAVRTVEPPPQYALSLVMRSGPPSPAAAEFVRIAAGAGTASASAGRG